ncbi:pertactin-like passenger domain-containing protein, partial [Mixta calida]
MENRNATIPLLYRLNPLSAFIQRRLAFTGALSLPLMLFTPFIVQATEYGSITVGKEATLQLSPGDSVTVAGSEKHLCGICNAAGASDSTLTLGDSVTINVDGPMARGIRLQGNNAQLQANQLRITANGINGIEADARNVSLNLGHASRIELTTNLGWGNGIALSRASTLEADALSIITHDLATGLYIYHAGSQADLGNNSYIQTNGNQASGIFISGMEYNGLNTPASLKANQLYIETAGNAAPGINIQPNSVVDLGKQSIITTQGEAAIGIWTLGELTAEALEVRTAGGELANAIRVNGQGVANIGPGSALYTEKSGALVAMGSTAAIHFNGSPTQRNTIVSGGTYAVSAQFAGANVNLSYADIHAISDTDGTIALWAFGGGNIMGDNLSIVGNTATTGAYAMSDSEIALTGKTVIRMASPLEIALGTEGSEEAGAGRITLNGQADIVGSVRATGGAIALDMASGSQLTGVAFSDSANGAILDMKMDQSRWSMVADSVVDSLTLNDSTVDFANDVVGTRLTVGELAGSGTFAMKTDIVALNSDKLVVTGSSAGNHTLLVRNRGDMRTTGQEVLTLVETPDGQANFALSPDRGRVELGGYLYDLRKAGGDWQLYAAGAVDDPAGADPEP